MAISTLQAFWQQVESGEALKDLTIDGLEINEDLEALSFHQCHFTDVKFRTDEVDNCTFTACHFLRCSFDSMTIRECVFDHCQFYEREQEQGCSFKFATVTACEFRHCDLSMACFSRANLYRTELASCQGQGIDLSHTSFESNIGGHVSLNDGAIRDCNMTYGDFTGANFAELTFSDNRLSHSILNEANLENAVMTDCELHGVEATGLLLTGADIRGSTVEGIDVREVDMRGVTIDPQQQTALLQHLGIIVSEA